MSALSRTTSEELSIRGHARTLLLLAARELSDAPTRDIARFIGVNASTVRRAASRHERIIRLVERVIGDPRFELLHCGDLRQLRTWHPYRDRF